MVRIMTTFLFVPGAFHGGWCFDLIRPKLEDSGHVVLTPTLSGVGEKAHLATHATINLDTHILDIVNFITWNDLSDVVLCAHSYGAFVSTGVADKIPERIASLVYIDAIIPQDGDTLFGLLPNLVAPFLQLSAGLGGLLVAPPPAAVFGVVPEHRDWVDSKLTPHPIACFTQKISLSGRYRDVARRLMVYSAKDIGLPSAIPAQYESLRAVDGCEVHSLGGGHDLMIDSADELADIMLQFVGR